MYKTLLCTLFLTGFSNIASAQDKQNMFNPVNFGVTSLMIPSDATGMALGDNGVATNPDNFSQYWNPAKYVFTKERAAIGHSYTPWLRTLVNDIFKLNTTGHYNFGKNAISLSYNFFSLGEVYLSEAEDAMIIKPSEHSFDIAYSRMITKELSIAAATRFIYSDITYDYTDESQAGKAISFDLATYWKHPTKFIDINLGAVVKNIGTKISYGGDDNSEFIPTNLSLGAGIDFHPHRLHHFQCFLQFDKLLVPTYPKQKEGEADNDYTDRVQRDYYDVSSVAGIFKSFGDAPGGFKEEMQEINAAIGFEYSMFNIVKFRNSYHHESKNKGNRKYYAFGIGLSFKPIDLNISYIRSVKKAGPLDQTLCMDFALKLPYFNKE